MPEPTEEARQLAREWLDDNSDTLGDAYGAGMIRAFGVAVDSLAALLDLVAMKTAAERVADLIPKTYRSDEVNVDGVPFKTNAVAVRREPIIETAVYDPASFAAAAVDDDGHTCDPFVMPVEGFTCPGCEQTWGHTWRGPAEAGR